MVESGRSDRCSGSSTTTTVTTSTSTSSSRSEELAISSKGGAALPSVASKGNTLAPPATAGGREAASSRRPPEEVPANRRPRCGDAASGIANGGPSSPASPASSGGLLPSPSSSSSSSSSCSTNTNTLSASPPPPPLPSPGASSGAVDVAAAVESEEGEGRRTSATEAAAAAGDGGGGRPEGGDVSFVTASRETSSRPPPPAAGGSVAVNCSVDAGSGAAAAATAAAVAARTASQSSLSGAENANEELRRPRLTWSAGDGAASLSRGTAGGVMPEAPASPPHYSLGEAGGGARGRWALEGRMPPSDLGGDGSSSAGQVPMGMGPNCRPRSATEGPGVEGGESGGGRGLFLSSRDSRRSDHETYSPGGSTKRGSPKSPRNQRSPRSPRSPRGSQSPLLERSGEKAGEEDGVAGKATGTAGDGGGGAGAFAEGGMAAGPISLLGYLRVEVFGAEDHGVVDTQANRTVRNFLTVPRQLERLLLFGMLVCLDTFLYVTTFLPIRIVIGLVTTLFSVVTRRTRPTVNRPLVYDWMRGATIAAALCCLQFLEMSRVYHYIRGQAMVKLYVLIAMVEIFDKLMCSFGQDALDSLYLSTVHKKKRRVLVHFAIVCVTACLHSLLLFVHVTTLTVAVNSSDQALLTLLISNNFAEIKSSVFKKFDKHNLFQLSCHDVVERFKLALFLAMIMLLNVCQGGLDDPALQFFTIFLMVFGGEVLADWIKHGFIIKFNQLTPSIYDEYSTILARDVAAFRKDDGSTLDHTHFVARRLAFATVPLNCVMIRFIQMAVPKLLQRLPEAPSAALWITAILFYLLALSLKVLTGITLMAHSCTLHPEAIISSTAAASWLRSPVQGAHKTRKELSLEKLSTIERFTLWKGRIV
eukprot:g5910.t2